MVKRLSWAASAYLAITLICGGAFAGAPPEGLDASTLYLRAGTVRADQLANLLAQPEPRGPYGERTFDPESHYVIQLDGPITPEKREALKRLGVELGDYLPQNAYVAWLGATSPGELSLLGFVRFVGVYAERWKIDPEIGRREFVTSDRQALERDGRRALQVSLFRDTPIDQAREAIETFDGAVVYYSESIGGQGTISVTIDADDIGELGALRAVQFVEEAPEITLRNSTTRWIVQSNVISVTPLYDNGLFGDGQIVGILDTKVDIDHCSFFDGVPVGPTHRKVLAYNTSFGAYSHGTHVAGIVVGDSGAFDDLRGIAYLGKLVYGAVPAYTETDIVNSLTLHHNQGARVHTNSWGDDGTTAYNSLARGFDVFCYDYEDDLVLLAVTNTSTLKNPENAKNLLAVGASRDTPDQSQHCTGGSGPTSDGRRKPEIYAPGCGTISARSGTSCDTRPMTGTSMACPAVAGTAMLVRQYYLEGYYPSGAPDGNAAFTPSAALLKATLLNSAVDMTGVAGYPSESEGWGRVLADDALYFAGDDRKLAVLEDVRNAAGLSTGEIVSYDFEVDDTAPKLKVTLVWTDPPAAAGASFAAVNDLDLEVVSPGGDLYLGNVFSGGVSVTGGGKDDRNNVEQVHVAFPEIGVWQVHVAAAAVNQGAQGYAIVVTGSLSNGSPPNYGNGDFEPDGDVDLEDFHLFQQCFGEVAVGACEPGNLTGSDVIDLDDLEQFVNQLSGPQ